MSDADDLAPPPGCTAVPERHIDRSRREVAAWRHAYMDARLLDAGERTVLAAGGRTARLWVPRTVDLVPMVAGGALRGIADPAELAAYERLLAGARRWLTNGPTHAPSPEGQLALQLQGAPT